MNDRQQRISEALASMQEYKAALIMSILTKPIKPPRPLRPGRKERTPDEVEGKVYTAFSPYVNHKEAKMLGITADRATVVAKVVGNKFVYGISICSHEDPFSRTEGRKKAIERLENNFAEIDATYYPQKDETLERAVIRFVNDIARRAAIDPNRYKRKICVNCKD